MLTIHARPLVVLVLSLGSCLAAVEELAIYRWSDLVEEASPGKELVNDGLRVQSSEGGSIALATLPLPDDVGRRYRLQGLIAYDLPDDTTGHLEQWNHLADGQAFFTRTVADVGPMRRLSGSSAMRPFNLPADASGGAKPERLVLNLVLPAGATATISDLRLIRLDPQDPVLDFSAAAELAPLLPPTAEGDAWPATARWLALTLWACFALLVIGFGIGLLLRRRHRRQREWQRMRSRDAADLA